MVIRFDYIVVYVLIDAVLSFDKSLFLSGEKKYYLMRHDDVYVRRTTK